MAIPMEGQEGEIPKWREEANKLSVRWRSRGHEEGVVEIYESNMP